jgi:hypothetical protein
LEVFIGLKLQVFNINEYLGHLPEGKGSRCVELAALPLPYAECLEILGASIFGALRASPGLCSFTFTFSIAL